MKKTLTWLGVVILIAAGSSAAFAAGGKSEQATGNLGNPGVLPPQSHAFGKTYAEWSAAWWQWVLAMPVDQNPMYDETGDRIANGQSGDVWFLAGVINVSGTAVRESTVPAGKALFFPVINNECSTLEAPPFHGDNYAELASCAQAMHVGNLYATIDGVPVQNLDKYFVVSPLYDISLPADNILGLPGPQTGQSATYGAWLMLAPLNVGTHIINFGGYYIDYNFGLDITYVLTVK